MGKSLSIILTLLLTLTGTIGIGYPMGMDFGGGSSTPPPPVTIEPVGGFSIHGTPVRVAVDSGGYVYVSDTHGKTVHIFSNNGVSLGTISGVKKPLGIGIGIDGSTIYIGDGEAGSVTAFNRAGASLFHLGSGDGEFGYPGDIAVSPSGVVYVVDSKAHEVKTYSPNGAHLASFGGTILLFPTGITIDDVTGEVYVADDKSNYIRIFSLNGAYQRGIRLGNFFSSTVRRPQGLALDAERIYITDAFNGCVAAYSKTGSFIKYLGNFGEDPGEFRTPLDAAFDKDGKLFVADYNNRRVAGLGVGSGYTSFSVSPSEIEMKVYAEDIPVSHVINVSSNAAGASWTAYAVEPWLSLSKLSGVTPSDVALSVDTSGLADGTYTGYARFVSRNGVESVVKVRLLVDVRKSLVVTPSVLNFKYQINSATLPVDTVMVHSEGGSAGWKANTTSNLIALDAYTGVTPATVNVRVAEGVKDLEEGTYYGKISIDAGDIDGSPAIVDTVLRVLNAGTVTITTNIAGAEFEMTGPENYSGVGPHWTYDEVKPGDYTVTFSHVPGYMKPWTERFSLKSGQSVNIDGMYGIKRTTSHIIAVSGSVHPDKANVIDTVGNITGSLDILNVKKGAKKALRRAVGDIDGDGLDEIAFSDDQSRIEIYRPNNSVVRSMEVPVSSFLDIAMGDMDNDGRDDLIAGTLRNGKRIVGFHGLDADNALTDKGVLFETGAGGDFTIAAGDIDGDGIPELMIADRKNISAYDVIDDLSFMLWSIENPYKETPAIAAGDVDGDGVFEVIIGEGVNRYNNTRVRILSGDGTDTVIEVDAFGDLDYRYGVSVTTGDIDGDFKDEIVVGAGPSPVNRSLIRIFKGNGNFTGITIDGLNTGGYGAKVGAGNFTGGMNE